MASSNVASPTEPDWLDTEVGQASAGWVREYIDAVNRKIVLRAKTLAATTGAPGSDTEIDPMSISEAAHDLYGRYSHPRDESVVRGWLHAITPITIISAFLAVAFGALALVNPQSLQSNQAGFLDIAKIFAGAVVGSSATSAVVEARARRM